MATIKRREGGLNPTTVKRREYSTAFSPSSIAGCSLWLDGADSSTITGTSPITAWTDKSGLGRSVTIVSGPTYGTTKRNGLNTLSFSNNSITTSIASAVGTGDFALIAVWYQSSAGTNTVLSLGTSASSSQSLGYSGNKYNFYQYGSYESNYVTTPTWVIQLGTRISSVKKVYINGNVGTTGTVDSFNQTVTTVTIGNGDSFPISGQLGEILIYTGTLSTTDQQKVESYLAQKWGLTGSLPTTHLQFTQPTGKPNTVTNPTLGLYPIRKIIFSFSSFSSGNLILVGNASLNVSVIQLTPNSGSQVGAAYYPSKLTITSFTSYFITQFSNTQADGMTFIIQNSSATAIGSGGGALGFVGISPSVGFRLDTYDGTTGTGPANFSTDILTNGSVPTDKGASGNLNTALGLTGSGTTWNFGVAVSYDGATLSYTITNLDSPSNTYTYSGAVNIPSIVGANTAWVGFTSATGGATEICSVSQWNFYN